MNVLKEKDILVVKAGTLLADYDRESIANLYQPIMGYAAHALYMTLWGEAKNQLVTSSINHGTLFSILGMNASSFVDGRKILEALGLLKTFVSEQGDNKTYTYQLFAPKSPKVFFDNALLLGMLIKAIGDESVNRLKKIYLMDNPNGVDISSSFVEVYHPDFDDEAFKKALNATPNMISHAYGKIDSSFSYEKFFECLGKISKISSDAFIKKDMKEIERLATLYGINEESAANGVASIFIVEAAKGKHIDYDQLVAVFQNVSNYTYLMSLKKRNNSGEVHGTTELGRKVNLMEQLSPKDFLSVLQNGSKPAVSDLYLINELSRDYKLPNSVINVVVDYTLTNCKNILSKGYATKVAASLARENITNVVDAMNYFRKVTSKTSGKTPFEVEKAKASEKPKKEEDLDWDKIMNELDDGGEDDGKA